MSTRIKKQAGFTLVEVLLYAVGMTLLLGVIVTMIYYAYGWYRYATISPRVDQAGSLIVDRIENDIRAGQTLGTITSNTITVNALDSTKAAVTYYYALQNGRIIYQKNGGTSQYISPTDLTVSQLKFTEIDTSVSKAIRFAVSIDYISSGATTTNTYSGLAIMRNSYQ